jgi:hypothetical protein
MSAIPQSILSSRPWINRSKSRTLGHLHLIFCQCMFGVNHISIPAQKLNIASALTPSGVGWASIYLWVYWQEIGEERFARHAGDNPWVFNEALIPRFDWSRLAAFGHFPLQLWRDPRGRVIVGATIYDLPNQNESSELGPMERGWLDRGWIVTDFDSRYYYGEYIINNDSCSRGTSRRHSTLEQWHPFIVLMAKTRRTFQLGISLQTTSDHGFSVLKAFQNWAHFVIISLRVRDNYSNSAQLRFMIEISSFGLTTRVFV